MIIVVIWVVLALLLGMSAKGRGRSFWVWFLLGILIDPILAWVVYKIVAGNR